MAIIRFRKSHTSLLLLEGMELAKERMIKEGLWNDNITFEELAEFAGSHVLITTDPPKP